MTDLHNVISDSGLFDGDDDESLDDIVRVAEGRVLLDITH